MSSSDLFTADYPHGTPTGYDSGCRGGACPGADMWGLTCRRAKELSRGDYRYQKLAKAGLTPAEIADELGLIPTGASTKPVTKRAAKPKPADEAADRAAGETIDVGPVTVITDPTPSVETTCFDSEVAPPTPKQVRTWAIEKGYDVKLRGTLPQHIIDHYWETHDLTPAQPATTEPELDTISALVDTRGPQVDTEAPETVTIVPEPDGSRPEWGYVNLTNDLAAAQTERDALTEDRDIALAACDDLGRQLTEAKGELTRARSLAARLEEELARSEQKHTAEISDLHGQLSDNHNGDRQHVEQLEESLAKADLDAIGADLKHTQIVTRLRNERDEAERSVRSLTSALAEASDARTTHHDDATTIRNLSNALELTIRKWAAERERGDHLAEVVATTPEPEPSLAQRIRNGWARTR